MNHWNPQSEDFSDRNFNPDVGGSSSDNVSFGLYVRNIPTDLQETGLKNLFSAYGNVRFVKLLPQKYPQGGVSGFVHYGTLREAEKAIKCLNNFSIGKYCIKVQHAKPKQEKQAEVSKSDYLSLLKKLEIGPLIEADLNSLIQKVDSGCFRNPLLNKSKDKQQNDDIEIVDDPDSPPKLISIDNVATGEDFSLSKQTNLGSDASEFNTALIPTIQEPNAVAIEMPSRTARYKCGDTVNLTVVDVNPNKGTFVCQFAAEEEQLKLKSLHVHLNQYQKHGNKESVNEINDGVLCATVYSADGEWYRGRIKGAVKERKVSVQFIDYGNIETVEVDQLCQLNPDFCKMPAFSINCRLWCVEKWSDKVTEFALQFLKQCELHVVVCVHEVIDEVIFGDVQANGISLVEHLQQKDLVSCNTNSLSPNSKPRSENMLHIQIPNEENSFDVKSPKEQSVPKELPNLVQESLPKEDFKVVVTHVNSPSSFYFQVVQQNQTELNKLQQWMSDEILTLKLQSLPTIGTFYAANCPNENRWIRVMVLNCLGQLAVKVLSVDFGNIEVISVNTLRQLPLQFRHLPIQAFEAMLSGGQNREGIWSKEALGYFKRIEGCTFMATVKDVVSEKYEVALKTATNKDVREQLLSFELKVVSTNAFCCGIPLIKPPLDADVEIIITEVEQGGLFYCQIAEGNIALFENITKLLKQHYEETSGSNENLELKEDTMYAVKSDNGQWYRAMVEQANENGQLVVRYSDFGNIAQVTRAQIYQLPEKFHTFPIQAIKCKLQDAKPTDANKWHGGFVKVCRALVKTPISARFMANCKDHYSVKVPKMLNKLITDNIAEYC